MQHKSGVEDLEFDLPRHLLSDLVEIFGTMESVPLSSSTVEGVPEEQGVYQIFHGEDLVYIGKTDSKAGLNSRLKRHTNKVQGRVGLDARQIRFKAIRLYVFTAMDLERLLIQHYKEAGLIPDWQNGGFGSNDPGRNRDETVVKPKNFDAKYPIDLDIRLTTDLSECELSVASVLQELKVKLPYVIRFEKVPPRSSKPHPDLINTKVRKPYTDCTVQEILTDISSALGSEWQVTALPGYVIIYKEKAPKKYPSGLVLK